MQDFPTPNEPQSELPLREPSPDMQESYPFVRSESFVSSIAPPPFQSATGPAAVRRSAAPLYWLLAVLVAMLVVIPFVERVSYSIGRGQQRAALDTLKEANLTSAPTVSELVAKGVGRSVVYIEAIRPATVQLNGPLRQLSNAHQAADQGSGVIIDDEGYILTNNHVVMSATKILVHLSEGRPKEAEVVGYDPLTDLAVLKIEAEGLLALEWGDSDELQPGQWVWAVGSPFGLANSITFGIVSAKGRQSVGEARYQNYLQTDAAVNPGNSGGPLVNAEGKVVGINTAIVGPSYQGVSFAIPSNMAQEVYERLKESGTFARGWLGVELASLDSKAADEAGVKPGEGVLIVRVLENSPAAQSGLRDGDVVLEWNGNAVADHQNLSWRVAGTDPGSKATATILRDGERQELEIEVGKRPSFRR